MKFPLILLFGMPRSGTTWVAKIFDSHPDTLYRHEPDSGSALKAMPLVSPPTGANQFAPMIRKFVAGLPELNSPRAAGSLPIFPKSYQSPARRLIKRFTALASKASESFVRELPVIDFIDYEKISQLVVVWKSIESLGRLGVILRVEPSSRAVIILRHPCGYVASVLAGEQNRRFTSTTASGDDFRVFDMLLRCSPHKHRNPGLEEIKLMPTVERLAWRWVLYNEIALADSAASKFCTVLRYEDLCSQLVAKAKELLRFTGLEWHAQVENFIRRSTSRRSQHYYSIFKDPSEASTKWQHDLNRASVDLIMSVIHKSDLRDLYPSVFAPNVEGRVKHS
jgi:hypothetical protein